MHRKLLMGLMLGLMLMPAGSWAETDEVSPRVERPVREAISTRQATQQEEEMWREEKEKLLARHDQLTEEIGRLEAHTEELSRSAAAAKARIATKQRQLSDTERIQAEIDPFLQEMRQWLHTGLADGVPFLLDERRERLQRLERLMEDPETAASEKFRKLMEALMVEAEYGQTVDVYQQNIPLDGQTVLVDVLRLGRLNLFYQTLDHGACGVFDPSTNDWRSLPGQYGPALRAAMEIAAKRRPVELLSLPLGRMVTP